MQANLAFGELPGKLPHIRICSVWRVLRVARERRGFLRERAYFLGLDRSPHVCICSVLWKSTIRASKRIRRYNFRHFDASGRGVLAYIAFRSSDVESVSVVREREGYAPWMSVNVAFGERPGGFPHVCISSVWRAALESLF